MTLRYVALGDSTVEGLEDPGPDGSYVGWADRLAQHLARGAHAGHAVPSRGVRYANLAVRGLTATEVRATQLAPALALHPDLAVVVAGVNDVLRPSFDPRRLAADLFAMHGALREAGAQVLTFTMPDMARVAPLAVVLRGRLRVLNEITRATRAQFGSTVVDLAAEPTASHPALWHDDRLHANPEGHRRIALALAEALALPPGGPAAADWRSPLPPPARSPVAVVARELAWIGGHLLPWMWRQVRRPPEEAPRRCKRPHLLPVEPPV